MTVTANASHYYIQGGPKTTIPKLTKMIDTNDIFGTNYNA